MRKLGADLLLFLTINVVFFIVSALLLWPFGKAAVSAQLAEGFCLFVIALILAASLSRLLQKVFGVEDDPPSGAYVVLNVIMSAFVQLGWAAFTALAASSHATGAPWLTGGVIYFVGLVASWLSTMLTGAFFQGAVYKTINSLLALGSYLVFAVWPGLARALYGWFFARF